MAESCSSPITHFPVSQQTEDTALCLERFSSMARQFLTNYSRYLRSVLPQHRYFYFTWLLPCSAKYAYFVGAVQSPAVHKPLLHNCYLLPTSIMVSTFGFRSFGSLSPLSLYSVFFSASLLVLCHSVTGAAHPVAGVRCLWLEWSVLWLGHITHCCYRNIQPQHSHVDLHGHSVHCFTLHRLLILHICNMGTV